MLDPARKSCSGSSCLRERQHFTAWLLLPSPLGRDGEPVPARAAGCSQAAVAGGSSYLPLCSCWLRAPVRPRGLASAFSDSCQRLLSQGAPEVGGAASSMAQQEKHPRHDAVSERQGSARRLGSAQDPAGTVVPTKLLKTFPIKSRASVSVTEIDGSDCSARSMCDGFSIICMAQLRLEEKIIRPHSVPLNVSVPSKSSGRI